MDIPPNQTLYVNNLPEKIKKHGGSDMPMKHRNRETSPFSAPLLSVSALSCAVSPCELLRNDCSTPWSRSEREHAERSPAPPSACHRLHRRSRSAELRQLLYALFGQFGRIIDVVAMRTDKLRGQVGVDHIQAPLQQLADGTAQC